MTCVKNLLGIKVPLGGTSPLYIKVSRNTPVTYVKNLLGKKVTLRSTLLLFMKVSRGTPVTLVINNLGIKVILGSLSPLYIKHHSFDFCDKSFRRKSNLQRQVTTVHQCINNSNLNFALNHLPRTLVFRGTSPLHHFRGCRHHSVIWGGWQWKICFTVNSWGFLSLISGLNSKIFFRDGGSVSVSVNIGIFWGYRYRYFYTDTNTDT